MPGGRPVVDDGSTAALVEGVLASLFEGDGAAVAATFLDVPTPEVTPEEGRAVAAAVPRRRHEFALGRWCARTAIDRLGLPGAPSLPPDHDRVPRWPREVAGSISHSPELCACVVQWHRDADSVGLDLEPRQGLAEELWPFVCTPAEVGQLERWGTPAGQAAIALFSLKEAFHKAQFPLTRRMLGFLDLEVEVHDGAARATARLADAGVSDVLGRAAGRFAVVAGHVVSGVVVSVEGGPPVRGTGARR